MSSIPYTDILSRLWSPVSNTGGEIRSHLTRRPLLLTGRLSSPNFGVYNEWAFADNDGQLGGCATVAPSHMPPHGICCWTVACSQFMNVCTEKNWWSRLPNRRNTQQNLKMYLYNATCLKEGHIKEWIHHTAGDYIHDIPVQETERDESSHANSSNLAAVNKTKSSS